ncbi:hypothetical protein [Halopelagius longus]|uniref:Uncharacterized protein n=1 Tax=Halopelagius longus TaxID=1236180 RepID=A0A1H0XRK6_9EURY|nr:hypothetical protein [Halopelagius longus]RDI72044.1 hypothetical protein DWB78_10120 [Halopelagius longus]SDQ05578.1 hypothetical protein SAMN05216278_0131 [Halopelagius longus]
MPSFFDPGHGFMSSLDEIVVMLTAVVLLTMVGAVVEYLRDSDGWSVLGALLGYVVAVLFLAPPEFAGEWHYAVIAAVPVFVVVYLYKGRHEG